jgi:hypothetical protein
MRFLLGVAAAITMTFLLSAGSASANGWRDHTVRVQMQRYQPDRFQRQPQRDFRTPPERGRRDARDGRLTDQERRDLHRDLDRANRELYKGRR